ncbi:MAG: MGMT family protein [Propionibacteriaceae bacterium]|jgi:alkylated DNA nucleotide flippase Atl1|nr:MGMT family protein [Propionibacteriaceae bacterium]
MGNELATMVLGVVGDIPPGRVMSYGDVAAAAGYPGAARQVGLIASQGGGDLPWHRVVRANGSLAGLEGGSNWQSEALRAEGVEIHDGRIDGFHACRWFPDQVG